MKTIRGRMEGCLLSSGTLLYSQDIDDYVFRVQGVIDYRLRLDHTGVDRLHLEYQAEAGVRRVGENLLEMVCRIPAIRRNLASGHLKLGNTEQVEYFAATHTETNYFRPTNRGGGPCGMFLIH